MLNLYIWGSIFSWYLIICLQEDKLYVQLTKKGHLVFAKENYMNGGKKFVIILENFVNMLLLKRDKDITMHLKVEVFILEFKYKDKHWAIDAMKEDNSLGCLINHSRKLQNCKPIVGEDRG